MDLPYHLNIAFIDYLSPSHTGSYDFVIVWLLVIISGKE